MANAAKPDPASHPARTTHPLFPSMTDLPRWIEGLKWIQVTRIESGRTVWCPDLLDPADFRGPADITNRFGGGDYEFIARSEDGRILTREKIFLPGPSRPLEGPQAFQQQQQQQQQQPYQQAQANYVASSYAQPQQQPAPPASSGVHIATTIAAVVTAIGAVVAPIVTAIVASGSSRAEREDQRRREDIAAQREHDTKMASLLLDEKRRQDSEKVDVLGTLKAGMDMASGAASSASTSQSLDKLIEVVGPAFAKKLAEDDVDKAERELKVEALKEQLTEKRETRARRDREGRGAPKAFVHVQERQIAAAAEPAPTTSPASPASSSATPPENGASGAPPSASSSTPATPATSAAS